MSDGDGSDSDGSDSDGSDGYGSDSDGSDGDGIDSGITLEEFGKKVKDLETGIGEIEEFLQGRTDSLFDVDIYLRKMLRHVISEFKTGNGYEDDENSATYQTLQDTKPPKSSQHHFNKSWPPSKVTPKPC